ncbi:amino acid ABC transporter substrate-binding protein [Paraburkholderia fungorum]|uniref:amino acid ABC transporter substrate-binding protein n=1 Tax=Paraburkholderia fungorum TaxID=134537 RepID=UPI0038BB418C
MATSNEELTIVAKNLGLTKQAGRRSFLASSGTLGLGACLAVCAPAHAADGAEDTLDKIRRTGVFNIGLREAAPPYSFKNASGQYVGFSTEIANAIYQAISHELGGNIKVNYVPLTSATRIVLLQNGTIDIEAGATVMTLSRAKVVDFSIPHFVTATGLLVRADSPIKSVADLAGKRVGIPQGGLESIMYQDAVTQGKIKGAVRTLAFPDHAQGTTALQTGMIDGYSTDNPILYQIASSTTGLRVVSLNLNASSQTMLIRPESSKFKSIVDRTIAQLCSSGAWLKLYDTYFGKGGAQMPLAEASKALVAMNSWPT